MAALYDTEEVKKDVEELSKIILEDKISYHEISSLAYISRGGYKILERRYRRELQILDVIGKAKVTPRFVEKLGQLWSKYQKDQLLLLISCCSRLHPSFLPPDEQD